MNKKTLDEVGGQEGTINISWGLEIAPQEENVEDESFALHRIPSTLSYIQKHLNWYM
jgi:hypothetical protein